MTTYKQGYVPGSGNTETLFSSKLTKKQKIKSKLKKLREQQDSFI